MTTETCGERDIRCLARTMRVRSRPKAAGDLARPSAGKSAGALRPITLRQLVDRAARGMGLNYRAVRRRGAGQTALGKALPPSFRRGVYPAARADPSSPLRGRRPGSD